MIAYAQDLHRAGAAVYLALRAPADVSHLRVERRYDDQFADLPGGPDTTTVYAGPPADGVLDWHEVLVGVPHWYAAYGLKRGVWVRYGSPVSVTPTAQPHAPRSDALDVLRERIEVGLNALLDAGVLTHGSGRFRVLFGPPALDGVEFPAVSLQLEQAAPDQQYIGGYLAAEVTESGDWSTQAGWYARYHVQVGLWSLNPDERRLLRASLRDILISNREIFELLGMQEMDVSLADHEDFTSYSATVYISTARLVFLAPCTITMTENALSDVTVAVTAVHVAVS